MKEYNCYANHLNSCEGGMTEEHILSSTLLGDTIIVLDSEQNNREIDKSKRDDFTLRILCRKHNQQLSNADNHFKYFLLQLIKDNEHTNTIRKTRNTAMPSLSLSFKGYLIERWCIKTFINYCFYREQPITPKINFRYLIPRIFAKNTFEFPYGLWMLNKSKQTTMEKPGLIQLQVYRDNIDDTIVGGVLNFQGHLFLVWLPSYSSNDITRSPFLYDESIYNYGNNLLYHPSKINMPIIIDGKEMITSQLRFKW